MLINFFIICKYNLLLGVRYLFDAFKGLYNIIKFLTLFIEFYKVLKYSLMCAGTVILFLIAGHSFKVLYYTNNHIDKLSKFNEYVTELFSPTSSVDVLSYKADVPDSVYGIGKDAELFQKLMKPLVKGVRVAKSDIVKGKQIYIRANSSKSIKTDLIGVGISYFDANAFVDYVKKIYKFRSKIGISMVIIDNSITSAEFQAGDKFILINKVKNKFQHKKIPPTKEVVFNKYRFRIKSNFLKDGASTGLSDTILKSIYRTVRSSNHYSLLYKGASVEIVTRDIYKGGRYAENLKILSIKPVSFYIKRGKYKLKAYSQNLGKTYSDNKGFVVNKTYFITRPVRGKGVRMTSGYGMRLHPIYKRYKKHNGVDYAAPRGTPVIAAASGRITRKTYNKYSGNLVKIRHNSVYQSSYSHLSRFARGIKVGGYIQKGDIIGYIGSTGSATGSHLHFEIKKNGINVNPLLVRSVKSRAMYGKKYRDFVKWRKGLDFLYKIDNKASISCKSTKSSLVNSICKL